jgi:hypothetical protein
MIQNDFFISHATEDHELVSELVDFMEMALKVDRSKVYCTSGNGTKKIRTGTNFIKDIRDNVIGTKLVIFILTPNYFKSSFCLAELGAAWALSSDIYPIVIPPTPRVLLKSTPFSESTQALTLNTYEDLVTMGDEFKAMKVAKYESANVLNTKAKKLISWIKGNCSFEADDTVSKADYEAMQKQLDDTVSKADYVAVQKKLETSTKTINLYEIELAYLRSEKEESAKVSADVHVNEEETTDRWGLFHEQVNSVKSILSRLDDIVVAAIYYDEVRRGSMRFWPSQNDFFNWNRAYELKAKNEIYVDEDDQQITPNYDQFLVGKAATKLRELSRYMSSNIDEDMEQEFAEDYEFNLEFTSIKFWEKILNVTIYV